MIRIGVLGTANIAERRMIPAILKNDRFDYAGVAFAVRREVGEPFSESEFAPVYVEKMKKAVRFDSEFGGGFTEGYEELLKRKDVDAVYIPLPPALHFIWAQKALEYGKHVLMEKPFTISEEQTEEIVRLAKEKKLALIENYGFVYHNQMKIIRRILSEGRIGELRLIRTSFGFPRREAGDFRYSKKMGGGALLDCGGYTIKAAAEFLSEQVDVVAASGMSVPEFDVDISGSGMLRDESGLTAQFAYGMDHAYKCELELWGSKGYICAPRIFTAPDGFDAPVHIQVGNEKYTETASDDQFSRVLDHFADCMEHVEEREKMYQSIVVQEKLVEKVRKRIEQG